MVLKEKASSWGGFILVSPRVQVLEKPLKKILKVSDRQLGGVKQTVMFAHLDRRRSSVLVLDCLAASFAAGSHCNQRVHGLSVSCCAAVASGRALGRLG